MSKEVRVLVRAVPEPCKVLDNGSLVISLVLQPDDSTDDTSGQTIDLAQWPSEIFGRFGSAISIVFDNGTRLPATPLEWIPRPTAPGDRNQLWLEAIGQQLLDAAGRTPPNTLVQGRSALFANSARRQASYVVGSPASRLAMSATAMTAASVFGQAVMHLSDDVADFAGRFNPLSPSTQQSDAVFQMFPGARPDQPTDTHGDDTPASKMFGIEGVDELAADTVTRIETYGRVWEPPSRVQPFFDEAHRATRDAPKPGSYKRYRRISAAVAKSVAYRLGESRANGVRGDGTKNFDLASMKTATKQPAAYYEAAWQAVSGGDEGYRSAAGVNDTASFGRQRLNDYADYLLSMQPDDQTKVDQNTETATKPSDVDQAQSAMAVIAGMYSFPQLAAFFGLIIDVVVPAGQIPSNAKFMCAEFSDGFGVLNSPVWTALAPDLDDSLQVRSLQVRARDPDGPDAMCSAGLLHLGEQDRFDIVSLNVNAAVDGWMNAARSDRQAREDGARRSDLASGLPAQSGVGLSIVDRLRRAVGAKELFSEVQADYPNGPDDRVLFLEDLIVGYRIDVAKPGEHTSWTWLSLMDREISFPDVEDALENSRKMSRQPSWPVDRLGGSVQPMHRDVQLSDETGKNAPVAVVYDTLACWRNWSLAVPAFGDVTATGPGEIQLARTIAPKLGSLPTFRFGDRVKFGARYMLINGSSIKLEDAADLYGNSATYVLETGPGVPIGPAGGGYPVLRHEPLPTPRLFHHKAPPADDEKASDARNVVVRTDHTGRIRDDREERIVLPGETTFDMAELHGALDRFRDLPAPPYQKLKLSPPLGTAAKYPVAQDPPPEKSVLSYPDPKARFLALAFTEEGQPAERFGYGPPVIVDLGQDRIWPNLAAVSIVLDAVPMGILPLHGSIVGAFDLSGAKLGGDGLARVKIRLAPAEQIDLTVWTLPKTLGDFATQAPLAATLHFAEVYAAEMFSAASAPSDAKTLANIMASADRKSMSFGRQMDEAADSSSDDDLLLRSLRRLPIPALTSYQTLHLVHAVERPLVAPAIEQFWAVHSPQPEANEPDHEKAVKLAWSKLLLGWAVTPGEAEPAAAVDAEKVLTPGSNRIFFGGSLAFHRKSSSRLDLQGSWQDYRDDIAPRRDKQTGKYAFVPELHVETMASIKDIPYRRGEGDEDIVGLSLDQRPTPQPTYLGYTFNDTRARSITVSARALSRFRGQFDDAEDSVDDRFSRVSDTTETLIVRSTQRPKQLTMPFCAPSLNYVVEDYDPQNPTIKDRSGVRHNRKVRIRVDLGERFYTSGYQERIGVVCWPPDLFEAPEIPLVRDIAVDDVDRQIAASIDTHGSPTLPKAASACVTRWGRDPIHESSKSMTVNLTALIPGGNFGNMAAEPVRVNMPLPAEKERGEDEGPDVESGFTLKVSLALFDAVLDPETGRFYADVEINSSHVQQPWITLGLVRYQQHSLSGLECSLPISVEVKIPADRQLELEVAEDGRLSLHYSGLGYEGAYIPRIFRENGSGGNLLSKSTLDVTVLRTPTIGVSGSPAVVEDGEADGLAQLIQLTPEVVNGEAHWFVGRFADGRAKNPRLKELRLPVYCRREDVTVLVTEREHYAADNFRMTLGTSRSQGSDFEEPLSWSDAEPVQGTEETLTISFPVSSVHLRLRPAGIPPRAEIPHESILETSSE